MTMAMGPTAPEPATEGKDLAGGYFILKIANATDEHHMKMHVSAFTQDTGAGTLLYNTPPAGLFSDADPGVTSHGLASVLAGIYTPDWSLSLYALFQMQSGQPTEIWPLPVWAPVVGTATQSPSIVVARAGQATFSTRDTAGKPFRLVALGSANWGPYAPSVAADNASGGNAEKIVHYLAANGAIRSHAGNKPLAPMKITYCLNNRLRREYKQR